MYAWHTQTENSGGGDDSVEGGGAGVGREVISLGSGNDTFLSSMNAFIGVRNDIVDAGAGVDSMEVDGTFASESLNLSAAGGHLIVVHNGRDRIDAGGVENVSYVGFGGLDEGNGDSVFVHDLSGTGVKNFTPDFSADKTDTAPDNSADNLVVFGTDAVDHISVSGSGANTKVSGLAPTITPTWLQPADTLEINTGGGDDTVDSSRLQDGLVQLLVF